MSFLRIPNDKSQDREEYRKRIASIQREAPADTTGGEKDPSTENTPMPMAIESGSEATSSKRFRPATRAVYFWSVRLMLVVMTTVLVGLILFLWAPFSRQVSATVDVRPVSKLTAMKSGLVAEPIARQWAQDAQLVSMSATWGADDEFQGGVGDWSLLYYSPSRERTALIAVHSGLATMIANRGVTDPITLKETVSWQIDSSSLINRLRAAGGDDFLRSQPEATISMSLDLAEDAVWRVRFIDQMSRRIFSARVSIDDGEILEIEQSG
jgi:hypothetical protein